MSIDAKTKVELKTPQLTLVMITQLSRHDSANTTDATELGSQLQSPLEVNVLLNLFCSSL